MGKMLVVAGILITIAGVLLLIAPNALSWFGNLPGDIKIQRGNSALFIPITSMLLLSVIGSIVLTLIGRLMSR